MSQSAVPQHQHVADVPSRRAERGQLRRGGLAADIGMSLRFASSSTWTPPSRLATPPDRIPRGTHRVSSSESWCSMIAVGAQGGVERRETSEGREKHWRGDGCRVRRTGKADARCSPKSIVLLGQGMYIHSQYRILTHRLFPAALQPIRSACPVPIASAHSIWLSHCYASRRRSARCAS
jgi:hypothetical protein